MDKKIAIFPVDYHTVAFTRYAYLGKYEPIALIAPALNVLDGADISKLDGGVKANIQLYANYKQKIFECDLAYFANSEYVPDQQLYHELITYAKEINKEVIVSKDVSQKLGLQMNISSDEQAMSFTYDLSDKLLPIEAPIVSLLTVSENCGQSETELSLRKYFLDRDYRIVQIGTKEYQSLLGCLELPSFLFDSKVEIEAKILLFNQYIYDICQKEEPDLIIMGVPNPIMKYNDEILNDFGILPFIMQSAVKSDIGVVNIPYMQYTDEYYNYVMEFCKYRLNIAPKYFGIANTTVSKNMDSPNQLVYLYLTVDFVKSNLKAEMEQDEYVIFPVFDKAKMIEAYNKIEYELVANPDHIT